MYGRYRQPYLVSDGRSAAAGYERYNICVIRGPGRADAVNVAAMVVEYHITGDNTTTSMYGRGR